MSVIVAGIIVAIGLMFAANILADALESATEEISSRLDLLLEPDEG
ncbi:hypothetical protein [Bradyrhizobium ottawaense]|uniref:Uncharacterized protein n=1 Tax=Bradyrhizobium ottawaense TaxID=931866 RepID=A0ABY0QH71_9BRAD|nr:hypothetical protein [Bradyrhizobium ottawaense]SDK41654.1 hypothetical protein SAMN05444163_8060 [Bradyrhizobium ottawaense]